jgi:hypothetical protein
MANGDRARPIASRGVVPACHIGCALRITGLWKAPSRCGYPPQRDVGCCQHTPPRLEPLEPDQIINRASGGDGIGVPLLL